MALPWLSILKTVLGLAASVAQIVQNKNLMDAGAAEAVLKGIKNAQKDTNNAIAAGNAADNDSVHDPFSDGPADDD